MSVCARMVVAVAVAVCVFSLVKLNMALAEDRVLTFKSLMVSKGLRVEWVCCPCLCACWCVRGCQQQKRV